MINDKKTYIVGHKNPDTDSIVSAIAYAELKRMLGDSNCFPARAGKLNPQTAYILERFDIPSPEFLSDLIPRVSMYMRPNKLTIDKNSSLWKALEMLNQDQDKMLPIIDEDGRYCSALHYDAFAQNMLKKVNPHQRPVIPTSLELLCETVKGKLVNAIDSKSIFNAQIIVAASDMVSIYDRASSVPKSNCIMMVGNRRKVQNYVIDEGYRCLIVTGNHTVDDELIAKANANGVSILLSPHDTVTTSTLALYSTPVSYMGDEGIRPLTQGQFIKDVRKQLNDSISRALPVTDDEGHVIGILSQGDLLGEPNINIIMVDHNERSQALEGIENYRILEIIDHHRLGNIHTNYPITFINKPVGSTSTIVAGLYISHKQTPSKSVASLLLCGILSDTLALRSATVTDEDKEVAALLEDIAGLDIQSLGSDIISASSSIAGKTANEVITMDLKKYYHGEKAYTISQIEVTNFDEITKRKDEFNKELESIKKSQGLLFASLMVTDITALNTLFFMSGDSYLVKEVSYPSCTNQDENLFFMKGIVSRKKQLVPYLEDLLEHNI